MSLKKVKLIMVIIVFGLCFLTHSLYDKLPNPVFAVFFPVNESIWEHMKMIYSSIILSGLIEFYLLKKNKIIYHNFFITLALISIISVPLYLTLYLPIYYIIGESFMLSISILLITIIIIEIFNYYLLNTKQVKYELVISLLLIIISYIVFGYLTYHPIKNDLFFDKVEEKYGINIYNIK